MIKSINTEIERVKKKLATQVQSHAEWSDKQTLLTTAPGVGTTLIYTLLADLPELGTLNKKEIAALVGVAPTSRDSGKIQRQATSPGWASQCPYCALYGDTECNAMQSSNQGFLQKVSREGKHKKVAITACMSKFITMLNAMVRDDCEGLTRLYLRVLTLKSLVRNKFCLNR